MQISIRMMRTYLKSSALLLLVLLVSACAGPREAAEPVEEAEELPVPEVNLSEYESFDPTPYEEPELEPRAAVEHDVPARLMEGRADEGIQSEVQGLRVQVHSSLDKNSAVQVEEELKEWLRSEEEADAEAEAEDEDALPEYSGELPIYVVYMQPYYRVRIGNFSSRQEAERARQYVSQRFPNALIVPDTVTITR